MLKKLRICVYTPVGYNGSLSTVNETCNKDKGSCTKKNCRCTSYKSPRTLKSGVHLFAALEKTTCRHPLWGVWLLLSPRAQRYFLTFRFGLPRVVRCTWTKWQWKLVHSPYQHPPAPCLRNYWDRKGVQQHSTYRQDQMNLSLTGLPVLVMNSQILFADSLTLTLLDWLG